MRRLEQDLALVTGGAAGLGKAIAVRLAAEGARVIITDVRADVGQQCAQDMGWSFFQQDVADEHSWSQVMRAVEALHGPLTVLVNNAGIVGQLDCATPENTPFEDWRRLLAVNADSVFLGCRAAIDSMRKAGRGSIINISSVAGLLATPYATAYGASKAVVRHLTKSVAQHCAQEKLNIRCNSVHPGVVLTDLWLTQARERAERTGVSIDEIVTETAGRTPLGKLTNPEDVASACAFLASNDSGQVTGTKLIVDGGVIECDTFRIQPRTLSSR